MLCSPLRLPVVRETPAVYRPRRPTLTACYRLIQDHFETFSELAALIDLCSMSSREWNPVGELPKESRTSALRAVEHLARSQKLDCRRFVLGDELAMIALWMRPTPSSTGGLTVLSGAPFSTAPGFVLFLGAQGALDTAPAAIEAWHAIRALHPTRIGLPVGGGEARRGMPALLGPEKGVLRLADQDSPVDFAMHELRLPGQESAGPPTPTQRRIKKPKDSLDRRAEWFRGEPGR